MQVDAEQLRAGFGMSFTPYWRCYACGTKFLRAADSAPHVCNGEIKHAVLQAIDVPTYTCKACGETFEEPRLPFEHECGGEGAEKCRHEGTHCVGAAGARRHEATKGTITAEDAEERRGKAKSEERDGDE